MSKEIRCMRAQQQDRSLERRQNADVPEVVSNQKIQIDPLRVFLLCTRVAGVLACFRADIRDSRQGGLGRYRSAALAIKLAHAYTVLLTNVQSSYQYHHG